MSRGRIKLSIFQARFGLTSLSLRHEGELLLESAAGRLNSRPLALAKPGPTIQEGLQYRVQRCFKPVGFMSKLEPIKPYNITKSQSWS